MLNNGHTQALMGIIRLRNEQAKLKGKKFLTEEELLIKERRVIHLCNLYNKVENSIVNNRFSIFIKESFYNLFGVPYPEFMYNDSTEDYVVRVQVGRDEAGHRMIEVSTTPDVKYALDCSTFWFWKKRRVLKHVNDALVKNGTIPGSYRFRRILTYN